MRMEERERGGVIMFTLFLGFNEFSGYTSSMSYALPFQFCLNNVHCKLGLRIWLQVRIRPREGLGLFGPFLKRQSECM